MREINLKRKQGGFFIEAGMLIALVVIGLVMADHWRQKTEEIRQTRADGLVKVFANAQNMVQKYQQLNAGAVPASTAVMVAALSPAATTSEVTFESNQITVTPVAAVKGVVLTMQNLSPDIASRATVKLQGATLTLGATARIDYPYAGDPTTATLSGFLKTDGTNSMLAPLTFGVSQTVGAACTTGQIGRDASGNVLACVSSVWKQAGSAYWQDPVANMATLNGSYPCSASVAWQTRVVQAPSVGSGPRAYTCDGTTWQALAVNDSGNLTIAGTATINALNGNLQVTAMAAEGAACTGEGRIASSTTTSGLILSCQSGVWRDHAVRSYVEYGYVNLSVCTTPDPGAICRVYSETVNIADAPRYLTVYGTHLAATTGGTSYVQILVDGGNCAISRSIAGTQGITTYSTATCIKKLSPGAHTITTYFVGDGGASVSDAKGARELF